MKIKRLIAIMLGIILILSLSSCGKTDETINQPEEIANSDTVSESSDNTPSVNPGSVEYLHYIGEITVDTITDSISEIREISENFDYDIERYRTYIHVIQGSDEGAIEVPELTNVIRVIFTPKTEGYVGDGVYSELYVEYLNKAEYPTMLSFSTHYTDKSDYKLLENSTLSLLGLITNAELQDALIKAESQVEPSEAYNGNGLQVLVSKYNEKVDRSTDVNVASYTININYLENDTTVGQEDFSIEELPKHGVYLTYLGGYGETLYEINNRVGDLYNAYSENSLSYGADSLYTSEVRNATYSEKRSEEQSEYDSYVLWYVTCEDDKYSVSLRTKEITKSDESNGKIELSIQGEFLDSAEAALNRTREILARVTDTEIELGSAEDSGEYRFEIENTDKFGFPVMVTLTPQTSGDRYSYDILIETIEDEEPVEDVAVAETEEEPAVTLPPADNFNGTSEEVENTEETGES